MGNSFRRKIKIAASSICMREMSLILPGLYIGGLSNVQNESQMAKNSITHVVSVYDSARPLSKNYEFLCVQVLDSEHADLLQFFSTVNDFIHGARSIGGSVLVHCVVGKSRSVTLVIAYVMTLANVSFVQAFKFVRKRRWLACPNDGFKLQLREFENNLQEEIQRFRAKFAENMDRYNDHEEIKKSLGL